MAHKSIYKESFRQLVDLFSQTPDYYIGIGNTDANVLIVGKEGATDIPENEVSIVARWRQKIEENETVDFNFRNPFRETFREGDTYSKYQKLHDYIFNPENSAKRDNHTVDFFRNFFTTEMNINRAPRSGDASKDGMAERKNTFFRTEFIRQFPVTVLACGNYIKNNDSTREIDDIFEVGFDRKYPSEETPGSQAFWTHYNPDRTKLVIHTRQLSMDVSNELLLEMARIIKEFLQN